MNLNGQINNVIVEGGNNTKVATINQSKIAKLQYLLTNGLYSDGMGSTIVEITNNALDSIIQSGKDPMKNPVYVYIERNSNGKWQLRIVDNGLGLDETEFSDVVMNYLTSTKEDDNNLIGAFGIGAKSWCSISNTATFICRKDGVERNFLCYKGEQFLKYDKVYEKTTTEENGVTFILPISEYNYWTYQEKAKQKLAYYDNVILSFNGSVESNTIYREEDFQIATMSKNSYIHFSLKDVYYTINWESLGIKPIDVPICLRFSLTDGIMPTPSRENIIYTEETKQLIINKIKKVALWFQNKYNSDIKTFKTLYDGWQDIGQDYKYVRLCGKTLTINSLMDFAGLTTEDPQIEGVKLYKPKFYKENFSKFFFEYKSVAYLNNNGAWIRKAYKFPNINNQVQSNDNVVLLDEVPVGTFKTYLGEEFGEDTLFIIEEKQRVLNNRTYDDKSSYKVLLNLFKYPKSEWRDRIKEWQFVRSTVITRIQDGRKLRFSDEYKQWLEDRKETQRQNRARGVYSSNYKALNKQKGEITVSKAREWKHGGKAVFDKMTVPINTLHKLGHLTVYFTKQQADVDRNFINKAIKAFPKVQFAWLNDREIKYVKDLKTWKTKQQFMFSKPLRRYITANLIEDYLEMIPPNEKYIYGAFPKYGDLKKVLQEYVNKNTVDADKDLFKELKDVAEQGKLWDTEIYPVLEQFKKVINDFGFLSVLKDVSNRYGTSEAEKKVINNMIYIMLKHKKVNCRLVKDYKLVEVDPVKDEEAAYFQPKLNDSNEIVGYRYVSLFSTYVWKSKEKLMEKYPNCIPVAYREGDIEDPEFQDVEDEDEDIDNDEVDDQDSDEVEEEVETEIEDDDIPSGMNGFDDEDEDDNDLDIENEEEGISDEDHNPYDEDHPASYEEESLRISDPILETTEPEVIPPVEKEPEDESIDDLVNQVYGEFL
jgi:hypothetical protein